MTLPIIQCNIYGKGVKGVNNKWSETSPKESTCFVSTKPTEVLCSYLPFSSTLSIVGLKRTISRINK